MREELLDRLGNIDQRLAEQIGSASRLFYLSPEVLLSKIFVYDDIGILHVHHAVTVVEVNACTIKKLYILSLIIFIFYSLS